MSGPLAGQAGRIDIWLAFERDIDKAFVADMYVGCLSEDERLRMVRFVRPADRDRYVITRALVRSILARYYSVEPSSLVFQGDAHGRPHVLRPSGDHKIVFNVSHADGIAALGVATGTRLGLDVEPVPQADVVDEVERYFAPEERELMSVSPLAMRRRRFAELWTLKEAYVKALGVGMSVPLDSFAFSFPEPGIVALREAVAAARESHSCRFWQFALPTGHVLAICSDRQSDSSEVLVHSVVPLVSEARLDCTLIRCSP